MPPQDQQPTCSIYLSGFWGIHEECLLLSPVYFLPLSLSSCSYRVLEGLCTVVKQSFGPAEDDTGLEPYDLRTRQKASSDQLPYVHGLQGLRSAKIKEHFLCNIQWKIAFETTKTHSQYKYVRYCLRKHCFSIFCNSIN